MARCSLKVRPVNKKGHLSWRLGVCVVVFGFVKCQRRSLRFFFCQWHISVGWRGLRMWCFRLSTAVAQEILEFISWRSLALGQINLCRMVVRLLVAFGSKAAADCWWVVQNTGWDFVGVMPVSSQETSSFFVVGKKGWKIWFCFLCYHTFSRRILTSEK